jgi:hypothetical protein
MWVLGGPRAVVAAKLPPLSARPCFNPLCPPLLGVDIKRVEGHPQTPGSILLHCSGYSPRIRVGGPRAVVAEEPGCGGG